MEAKAGANRDYAIAEMDENYEKNRYCDWCGLVDWCARICAGTCAELNTGTVLRSLPFNYNRVILHRRELSASHVLAAFLC